MTPTESGAQFSQKNPIICLNLLDWMKTKYTITKL